MAKFAGLQIDADNEDEVIFTFQTTDGASFTFTASADDVVEIADTLDELFEDPDDAEESAG
jgi:hypothetical protein